MQMDRRLMASLTEMLEKVATEYCDDLGQFLYVNHRITGLLASSIGYERISPVEVNAGSNVPYAGYFEAKTGAVLNFTNQWQPRAGDVAVRVVKKVVNKNLPK
jgi:hypothetical protein